MVDVIMDRNYVVINLFQNTFILRRFRAANFANIVKIATMLIKTISGEKILTSPELTGLNCQI